MSRLRAAAPALLLLVALLSGGLRPTEGAIAVGLGVLAVGAAAGRRGTADAGKAPWAPSFRAEGLVVAALTLAFAARAGSLPTADQPLGTDWFAYLKNALAIADGDWAQYHRWRGPLHGWICATLAPAAGDLVAASQLVSTVALTLVVPLGWGFVRTIVGPVAGVVAAFLLASSPDLALFARMSTPYPLLAALVLAGACAALAARRHPAWALPAGVLLAGAALTDPRGEVLGVCVVVGLLAAGARPRVAAAVAGVAVAVATTALLTLPVELVPLAEQVGLQRDLNATGQAAVCTAAHGAFPTPGELVGPCAAATLGDNLARAQRSTPVSLAFVGLLVLAGARRRTVPLLLPILPALPSLLLVRVMHRYGVPLAPFAAGLAGTALVDLAARAPRVGPLGAGLVAVGLAGAWNSFDGSLLARAHGARPEGGAAPAVVITEDRGLAHVRRLLREGLGADDLVVDCARAGLRMRLYPRPVQELGAGRADRQPERCRTLLAEGAGRPAWLLVTLPPGTPVTGPWETVTAFTRADAEVVLLRTR